MASSDEIRQWLLEVNDIDAQAATLERAVVALDDCADVTLVDDVLGVFERCSGQDDYGMFASAQSWIEGLADQGLIADKLRASLARRPSWKVIEMLPSYCGDAADLLQSVLETGSFDDRRYEASWLERKVAELRANG